MLNKLRILLVLTLFGLIQLNGYSQCGTETVTPVSWCNNDFAQWNITDPQSPNATYYWYNYTGTVPTLNANGFITSETLLDSTTSNVYYSSFRATTAADPAGVQYTYVRTVNYNAVPFPGTTPAFTTVAAGSTFSMTFTSTSAVIMNYVEVPVVLNTPGKQYKIQVTSGTTAGPGSAIYTFSTVGATSLGGNNYLIKIPVNYTFAAGPNTLVINSNPAGGTGAPVDGLLYSPTQFAGATYGPVTIGAASAAGNYSLIYNWNFTQVCSYKNTPSSVNTTVGCCTVPASLGLLNLGTNYADIVNGGSTNATLTVGSAVPGDYIAWYLNGVLVPAASGVNKTTYTTNQTGTWSVRDAATAANLSNPSCYVTAQTTIQNQQIFLTTVSAPSNSPLCIGNQWTFAASGASNLTWTSGPGILSATTGDTTIFTGTSLGSSSVTVTGNVISGNEVINGDFSSGATGFTTEFASTGAGGPGNTNGSYGVNNISSGGTAGWPAQSDWNAQGNAGYPYVSGNPGNFLVLNGYGTGSGAPEANPLAWGQSVAVSPNQPYTFAFDFTPVTYFISTGQSGNILTPGGTYEDIQLGVFINGTQIGTVTTNFASTGLAAVGQWNTYSFNWTSGASITSADLEIRQMGGSTDAQRGYDFGLDNISFGGLITQSQTVNVGPLTDCSTLTASASACYNDTMSILTATMTGGLVFDYWKNSSGTIISTSNPDTVNSKTAATYTAYATLAAGNLLDNGSFQAGNVGFLSGGPYYTYKAPTTGNWSNGGTNQYTISANTTVLNSGGWDNLPISPGSTGSQVFTADAKGPLGHPVIGWSFSAIAGQTYYFSGWVADQHVDFKAGTTIPVATLNMESPDIGVYINSTNSVSATSYSTDPLLTSLKLPNNQNWNNLTSTWVAPSTGTFTLYLVDLNGESGGGNDFLLDNFSLTPSTGIVHQATTTTPLCNPCLNNTATVKTATFCANTGVVQLTPTAGLMNGVYSWYPTATSTTVLGTTIGSSKDSTLNVSTATVSGADRIVYYTMTAKSVGNFGNVTPTSCTSISNQAYGQGQNLDFIKNSSTAIIIDTITIWAANTGQNYSGISVVIYNAVQQTYNGNHFVHNSAIYTSPGITVVTPNSSGYTMIKIPVNYTLTGAAGTNYSIGLNSNSLEVANFNCNLVGTTDNIGTGGPYLTATGSDVNSGWSSNWGTIGNVHFQVVADPCPRVAVTLTPACPCTKPSVVSITTPATSPVSLCQGTAQTLSGKATVTAASINGGFYYSWRKTTPTPVVVEAGPTVTALTINTATAVPNYTGITGVLTDSGTYVLRVEDGNAGNASCYTEATVVVKINPTPTVSSASTGTVCSGVAQNYAITSVVPSSYSWSRAAVAGISNVAATAQTSNPIIETLTNTTTAAVNVTYLITPTSTTGACVGPVFTYTVTVNPSPTISSAAAGTICSGVAQNYTITSVVPSSYKWSRAVVAGISNAVATNQTTNPITEVLTNTTTAAVNVTYIITPTSTTGTCAGTPFNYVVTVNPAPTISSVATGTVCSGVAENYTITSVVPSSYSWSRAAVAGISNTAGTGTTTPITETLTNTTTAAVNVTYIITPTSTTGTCAGTPFNYVVTVNPKPTISSAATGTICSGVAQNYAITSVVPSSYSWTRAAVAGISNTAGTGTTTPITETLTNTTTAAVNVTYIITPTSTTGSCAGTPFNYVVTVNPKPTISSAATGTICSGVAQNYAITSVVPSSYSWTRAAVAGISNTAGTGTTTPITETLTNTTTAAVNVTYIITPTSTTGTCAGTPFNYVVTVNPAPTISSAATGTICSGVAQNYTITSVVPSSYSWTRAAVAGISNTAGTGTTTPITETLTNTTTAAVNVTYIITPTSTTGTCAGTPFNYVVTVNPAPTISSAATGTVCSGVAENYAITSVVPSSYSWSRAAVAGISNAALTNQAINPITETLTNTTTAAVNVTYIITPTSTTGACAGTPFNYVVTVNPKPTISSAATGTICSGVAQNYAITSVVPSSYSWSRAVVAGISNAVATNQTANPITEVLTNTTTAAVNVTYIITPTSTTGTCAGTPFNYVVTVNPAPVPAVTVTANNSTICAGTSITFTAAPTNQGTAPTYQWYKNGSAIGGATASTYTTTTAVNNDSYDVVLTSNASCASPLTATSNAVVITVTTVVAPLVTISPSPSNAVCAGTTVTFTATPGNGGTAPTYQWILNGTNVGAVTTTATYSGVFANGDQISVLMTSNSSCASPSTATSAITTMTVTPNVTPSVTTSANNTTICPGGSVTITAVPTNGGTTPTYQWRNNGTNIVGATGSTYTTTGLVAGNSIDVVLTSSITCVTSATGSSTPISITVTPNVTPSVSISANANPICTGGSVTFTAVPTNGGVAPTYQWQVNSSNSGASSTTNTFTSTTLNNGDIVTVILTSNAACPSPATATSNGVTMIVNAGIGAGTISSDQAICNGAIPATINTATAPTGVTTPTYTWEASVDGGATWNTIPGQTGTSLTSPLGLTVTTQVRKVVTDLSLPAPCNVARTNAVTITVYGVFAAGSIGYDSSSTTICSGNTPVEFTNIAVPTGGTRPYTYTWDTSIDGGTTWIQVSGASDSVYVPTSALTQTTMYRRHDISAAGCGNLTTGPVTITVNPIINPGAIGSNQSICSGTAPAPFTEVTPASGGTGTYTYQWQLSTDNVTYRDTINQTAATFTGPSLTVNTYFRRTVLSGSCAAQYTAPVLITILPGLNPGTINGTSTICYGATPGDIASTSLASGGAATYTYSWQQSTDGGTTWSLIAGAANTDYQSGPLTTTTLFQRIVVSGTSTCNTAYTTAVTITVNADFVVGSIGSNQTICSGVIPSVIHSNGLPSGGSGSYSYTWEDSISGGNWQAIGGATLSSYAPPSLSQTTYYRRHDISSAGCGNLTTNIDTVTVIQNLPVKVSIVDPGQSCAGALMVFTATPTNGGTTPAYQWTVNGGIAGTGSSYSSTVLNNNDKVQVQLTSSLTCTTGNPALSNIVTVQIVSNVTPSITIANPSTICSGTNTTLTTTSSGGGATPTYQWYLNGATAGTNASTFSSNGFNAGDQVYVVMTSSLNCATQPTGTSNTVTLNVLPVPNPVINHVDTTICSGSSVVLPATVGTGTLSWTNSGVAISGAATSSLTVTKSGSYVIKENNGTCSTSSAAVNVTVIPTPNANAGADVYVKEGQTVTLNGSGGAVYSWTPSTGLSNPNTANPSFVATNDITYVVRVADPTNTCYTSASVNIVVEKPVIIPNAFTPNGDGDNDNWQIRNIEGYPNVSYEVFNRWGNIVWKHSGNLKNWDGTDYQNGQPLPDGTYFYVIKLNSPVYTQAYTGYVQIVR